MNVVTVYACQACGTLSGKPNSICCADPEPKPFVIDVEAEPQAKPFPDLVESGVMPTETDAKAGRSPSVTSATAKTAVVAEEVKPEVVFREQFTPDEVERIRKMIEPVPESPHKAHWWQRG